MSILRDNAGNPISQDNPLPTQEANQAAQKQVGIYYHESQTIQTHNAVVVTPTGSTSTSYIDCLGYSSIAFSYATDSGSVPSGMYITWSHDGTSGFASETPFANSNRPNGATEYTTKARYVRVTLTNGDTVNHTMSAWVFLKA